MRIRRALIGSTLLFAAGCWGSSTAKVGADLGVSDPGPGDTSLETGTDTGNDAEICYQTPDDPKTLIGQPCFWDQGAECVGDWPVVQCMEGTWVAYSDGFQDPEEGGCACDPATEPCQPATLTCWIAGFVGVHKEGASRAASRSLRQA